MRTRLLLAFAFAATFVWTNVAGAENIAHGVRVLVLDAGHGGSDPGAHYGGVREKDLTLKVVLRLGKLIEQQMPGVEVVYTRKTDKALGPTKKADLQARADIANEAGGDLFISVHVNAAVATAARGVETLVMGETPLEQQHNQKALFENNRDDLIDMSDERTAAIVRAYIQNLQFTYGEYSMTLARCIQNSYLKDNRLSRGIKRQPLMVLYATDMPCVLTEIGFLSNPAEAAYLKSEKGLDEIAQAIFRAVKEYSTRLLQLRGEVEPGKDAVPAPEAVAEPASESAAERPSEQPETKNGEAQTAAGKPAAGEPVTGKSAAAAKNGAVQTAAGKPAAAAKNREVQTAAGKPVPAAKPRRYAVQVLASARAVPLSSGCFKSYRGKVKQYTADGPYRYKYCVGECDDAAAAQKKRDEVHEVFPGAFVVRCQGSQIVK